MGLHQLEVGQGVSKNLVLSMEKKGVGPSRMPKLQIRDELTKVGQIIEKLADHDILVWLDSGLVPSKKKYLEPQR